MGLMSVGDGSLQGAYVFIYSKSTSGLPTLIYEYIKNGTVIESYTTPNYNDVISNPISFHGVQITYSQAAAANWGIYAETKCFIPTSTGKQFFDTGALITSWVYSTPFAVIVYI